jgi:hypothetical protein
LGVFCIKAFSSVFPQNYEIEVPVISPVLMAKAPVEFLLLNRIVKFFLAILRLTIDNE